jgi:hypothetical protein
VKLVADGRVSFSDPLQKFAPRECVGDRKVMSQSIYMGVCRKFV